MSARVVLDAAAALEAVLPGPRAAEVLDALASATLVLAPGLLHCEVANVLWKLVRHGDLPADQAPPLLEAAAGLVDVVIPDEELTTEALGLALTAGHTVYDMTYAVLARRHACAVLTMDQKLARTLRSLGIPTQPTARA